MFLPCTHEFQATAQTRFSEQIRQIGQPAYTASESCSASSHGSKNAWMPLQADAGESLAVEFVAVQIFMWPSN